MSLKNYNYFVKLNDSIKLQSLNKIDMALINRFKSVYLFISKIKRFKQFIDKNKTIQCFLR